MRTPQTCTELNAALYGQFDIVTFSRSFIELPFKIAFQGLETTFTHRVVPASLALRGLESDCCKEIWITLIGSVPRVRLEDRTELLFLRSEFSWEPERSVLQGRLAFWHHKRQEELLKSRAYRLEGTIPREALCA